MRDMLDDLKNGNTDGGIIAVLDTIRQQLYKLSKEWKETQTVIRNMQRELEEVSTHITCASCLC